MPLAWLANLGCLELHPYPVRAEDLDHPDQLRVELDPVPGIERAQVRRGLWVEERLFPAAAQRPPYIKA